MGRKPRCVAALASRMKANKTTTTMVQLKKISPTNHKLDSDGLEKHTGDQRSPARRDPCSAHSSNAEVSCLGIPMCAPSQREKLVGGDNTEALMARRELASLPCNKTSEDAPEASFLRGKPPSLKGQRSRAVLQWLLGWLLTVAAGAGVAHPGVVDLNRAGIIRIVQNVVVRSVGRGAVTILELLSRAVLLILALVLSFSPSMREKAMERVRFEVQQSARHLQR